MKKVSDLFFILAIILGHVACAVVAYEFCDMECGIRYGGYSAPAWTAFLTAIPYGVGIASCLIVAVVLRKKAVLSTSGK